MVRVAAIATVLVVAAAAFLCGAGFAAEAPEPDGVQDEPFEQNMKRGLEACQRAEKAGLQFVLGKEADAQNDKLFGPFLEDNRIYNVIYDRYYYDKNKALKSEQRAMFPDRLRIEKTERGKEENGVRLNYAFAEDKTLALVIASRPVKPAEGEVVNMGGMIVVLVAATNDRFFDKMRTPKASRAPEQAGEK